MKNHSARRFNIDKNILYIYNNIGKNRRFVMQIIEFVSDHWLVCTYLIYSLLTIRVIKRAVRLKLTEWSKGADDHLTLISLTLFYFVFVPIVLAVCVIFRAINGSLAAEHMMLAKFHPSPAPMPWSDE